MKVIIAGAGIVGVNVAKYFIAENHDVVMIEADNEAARFISNRLDCIVCVGSASNLEVLEEAGITDASYIVCVTGSDEHNIIIASLVSYRYEHIKCVARISQRHILNVGEVGNNFLGINHITHAKQEIATTVQKVIEYGALSDVMVLVPNQLHISSVLVENSHFFSMPVQQLIGEIPEHFLIVCIMRKELLIIPSGSTLLQENDIIYLCAKPDAFEHIFHYFGKTRTSINKILLVGASETARYIMDDLLIDEEEHEFIVENDYRSRIKLFFQRIHNNVAIKKHRKMCLVEKDYQRAKDMANYFANKSDVFVLNADIREEKLFSDQKLNQYDLIIMASENQELNVMMSIYAKQQGISRSIALLRNAHYTQMASQLGVDVVININDAVVQDIIHYILRNEATQNNVGKQSNTIIDGTTLLNDFIITVDSPAFGKVLKKTPLPHSALIIAIQRDNRAFLPDGNVIFQENDIVTCICTPEKQELLERALKGYS